MSITREPREAAPVLDALRTDEVVCIAREQRIGTREWAFISQRIPPGGQPVAVGGWANANLLEPLSEAEAARVRRDMAPAREAPKQASPPPRNERADPPARVEPPAPRDTAKLPEGALRYTDPIGSGPDEIRGRSIEQLALAIPTFSPVEGLDAAVWKQPCSACHKWDKRQLCDRGASYGKDPSLANRHPHPFGAEYKTVLMEWARGGCP